MRKINCRTILKLLTSSKVYEHSLYKRRTRFFGKLYLLIQNQFSFRKKVGLIDEPIEFSQNFWEI